MADTKITALTALTGADPANDVIPIVDVSDTTMAASGTTKKISVNNILGASGTATLASATITGDLTVDTNVLKVDTTNNRVGVGTASPATLCEMRTAAATDALRIYMNGAGTANIIAAKSFLAPFGEVDRFTVAGNGVCTWSNVGDVYGTSMTLNANGLGVKGSPISPLTAYGATVAKAPVMLLTTVGSPDYGWDFSVDGAVNGNMFIRRLVGGVKTDVLEFDRSNGNVGIGVTPSAWAAGYKVIQGQIGGFALSNDNSSNNQFRLSSNAYFDTTDNRWEYYGSSTATAYEQRAGEHRFFNATSGTVNTAITFTQAMTLDAVRGLHVDTTAYVGIGVGVVNAKNGFNIVPDNTGNAANRNWNFATNGSSAGNLDIVVSSANNTYPNFAYRMQLTSAGAAYNTTGTWGTISDSRLKENISDARNYLADLLKLRVVKYSLKEEASAVATKLGLIAQEVEQVFPSLVEQSDVAYDGGDGIRTVKTSILVPMLLKAIQELTARVQTLEAK